ncbi:hypothetical protein CSW62_06635 [Caulobacter sp. FWC2]|nr:hypothetical protein CSW62_06635 [Caulobacter sp. FWC2]
MLLTEAARALPALKARATDPAGYHGVKRVIGRRFALFPQPERSDGEWAEFWADYTDVLGDLTEGAVEAAMAAWVRRPDAEFLPKPGKLLELARTTPNRAVRSYERAKAAMDYKPPRRPHPADSDPNYIDPSIRPLLQTSTGRVEPTAEDKARVRAQLAHYLAKDDERRTRSKSVQAPRPDVSGRVDESGITPQLRSLLERQAQA